MHRPRCAAFACTAALLVLLPVSADAATRSVSVGTPGSARESFERLQSDVNAFFPSTTTIRQGDSVRFVPAGFHTAHLPLPGRGVTPIFSPTGQKVSGVNDEAGAPFWFNGQDQVGITPSLAQSNWGKRRTYTGRRDVNSGLPLTRRPRPMSVRFTRRGTFRVLCDVHPGMRGTVRVRGRSATVPTARQHARSAARQVSRARERARDLADSRRPANTVDVGVAASGGVERFAFVPERTQVARGTTVTFRMTPRSLEAHTATAGPGDPMREPSSYLGTLVRSFESPLVDPRALYPSDPPGSVASLSPSLHGNGFWNSGVLDTVRGSPPPASAQVRFDTPGSYRFVCLIHPFMVGTVDVG